MPSDAKWATRRSVLRGLLASPSSITGIALAVLALAIAFLGPLVSPYSPTELGPPRALPSPSHLMGTDPIGRDVLARVLHGGLDVVLIPAVATTLAFGLGAIIGMWSGYVGGTLGSLTVRVNDVMISLPPLLLAIVLVSGLSSSVPVLVFVTVLFFTPRIVRVIRGSTAIVVASDYVVAARVRGDSTGEILRREIMPNISGVLVVEYAARLSNVVIFIATLNFLGLGAQPPSANWGLMVSETKLLLRTNPLAPLVPAVLIASLAVGVNLLAGQLAVYLSKDRLEAGAR